MFSALKHTKPHTLYRLAWLSWEGFSYHLIKLGEGLGYCQILGLPGVDWA